MKRKLMALMLAGIMVIQSAGTIQATDFTDGQEIEEFSEKTESIPEKDINAFSDIQTTRFFLIQIHLNKMELLLTHMK